MHAADPCSHARIRTDVRGAEGGCGLGGGGTTRWRWAPLPVLPRDAFAYSRWERWRMHAGGDSGGSGASWRVPPCVCSLRRCGVPLHAYECAIMCVCVCVCGGYGRVSLGCAHHPLLMSAVMISLGQVRLMRLPQRMRILTGFTVLFDLDVLVCVAVCVCACVWLLVYQA